MSISTLYFFSGAISAVRFYPPDFDLIAITFLKIFLFVISLNMPEKKSKNIFSGFPFKVCLSGFQFLAGVFLRIQPYFTSRLFSFIARLSSS